MSPIVRMPIASPAPHWGWIGTALGSEDSTVELAMETAKLNWTVDLAHSGYRRSHRCKWRCVPGDCYLVRSSDDTVLGCSSQNYKPFQNIAGFEFLDPFIARGGLLLHTAGELDGGRRVWLLAQTPKTWTIKRRSGVLATHHAFILAVLGHSGSEGLSLRGLDIRAEGASNCGLGVETAFRIPHRGELTPERAENSTRDTLGDLCVHAEDRRRILQAMADTPMSTEEFVDFATTIFMGLDKLRVPANDMYETADAARVFYATCSEREKTIMENRVSKVAMRFLIERGDGDSLYDALTSFNAHFDRYELGHVRPSLRPGRAAKAVNSAWLGAGAATKALVYKRLRQRVGA